MDHTLPDGRTLAWAEFGDPHGKPLFFFHGAPGSRLLHPPDDVTRRMGVRLIGVDRPGYGGSTFQPRRRILDWPDDVASLADELNLDRFAVAAHSAGGPHALACAYRLPDRVSAEAILSGSGPVDAPGATSGMTFLNWLAFKLGQYMPWPLARALVSLFFREQAANPAQAVDTDKRKRCPADEEIMSIPSVRANFVDSDVEAYGQGLDGFAWDVRLVTRAWGFPLEAVAVPVDLWHGTADNLASLQMARYMAEKIPGAKTHFFEGEGHLMLIPHWEEILGTLFATERT